MNFWVIEFRGKRFSETKEWNSIVGTKQNIPQYLSEFVSISSMYIWIWENEKKNQQALGGKTHIGTNICEARQGR